MDENKQKNAVMDEAVVHEEEYHKEPKINYIIYTIISILLFAVIYAGVSIAKNYMFRDYTIVVDGGSLVPEQFDAIKEYTDFDFDTIEQMTLTRENNRFIAEILYNIGDYSTFSEDHENYAEDESNEEIRLTIYPYGNSVPEYVYASYFINTDVPDMRCYIYEYEDNNYLKLLFENIPEELERIFSKHEKNYRK